MKSYFLKQQYHFKTCYFLNPTPVCGNNMYEYTSVCRENRFRNIFKG